MARILLILCLAACSLGAETKPAAKPVPKTDAAIEAAIRARLSKSKISANGFTVRVQNGVATITGKAEVVQHKGVATRLAKAGGATEVINNIEVSAAAREKAANHLASIREKAHQGGKAPARSQPAQRQASTPAPAPATAPGPAASAQTPPAPPPVRRAVIKTQP